MSLPLPEGPFRFIALDVETAASDSASICQIGLACVRADATIETWVSFVDPCCAFSRFNTALHGIGPAQVRGAPAFAQLAARLEPLLGAHLLIQHSGFDKRAIAGAYAALGRLPPQWRWGDSVRIARRAWPEFTGNGGHGLAHLKTQLNLRFTHHDAGEDARAAAEVVLQAEGRTGLALEALLGKG
ncbi:exonuclease domain-containing protein [Rhodobacter lacus]|uniref:Exonuclease domain-containing protein n=1 Tax=Rhodobacter lacus TaxID=1641972 RepID=A0ABW5ABH9_9RHOB